MTTKMLPQNSFSIKNRLCLVVGVTVMTATMLFMLAVSLVTYSQTRRQNGERLNAAIVSYQRDLERMIVNDQKTFRDFSTNLEIARKYHGMVVTNFSSAEMPGRTTNLALSLNAQYLAFYYKTKEESNLELRHYFVKEMGGTVVVSEDYDSGRLENVLYVKSGNKKAYSLEIEKSPEIFPKKFEPFSQSYSLLSKNGLLLLVVDLPFFSFFDDRNYRLEKGILLGRFVLKKELELDLNERDSDFGLYHNMYDINGRMGDGQLSLPDLDLSKNNHSQNEIIRLTDANGIEYDSLLRPLLHQNYIIGYLSVSISREGTFEEIAEKIKTLLLIGFVITLLIVIFAWKFVGRFMNPILELTKASTEIASGNLEKRIDTSGKAELGVLAHSFAHMRDSIHEKITSLNKEIKNRKRAEEELRRLRNLLGNIINSMPSVLVGVDSDGRVTQWNREAEKASGIAANEARGRILTDVLPQLAGEMDKVHQAIRDRHLHKDTKVPRRDGEQTRFSDVTVYPLIANGVEGAVIRIDDVTDRVRIEEMMVQSEKMLSVGGLAAGMAHEINNPLAGILQSVQVIRNRVASDLPKNQRTAEACGIRMESIQAYMEQRGILTMIESVMESGRRAAQIVNDMLSFSRKSESKFAPYDPGELLDRTVNLAANDYDLKKQYDFRRIRIIRDYAPDTPAVWCEAGQIQQVFLNLLKNGAQAMVERDQMANQNNETPCFKLRLKPEGSMARIEIEDNGPGMEKAVRKRIFEPFFTTKDVGVGTGLGLSVSYFIITENHGGTMFVESTPGKGSNFIIQLPAAKTDAV